MKKVFSSNKSKSFPQIPQFMRNITSLCAHDMSQHLNSSSPCSALKVVGAIIFQPINRGLPLRCLEEKYGLSNNHRDRLMAQERRQKRLSLNITNGHSHDSVHGGHDGTQCRDGGVGRGGQLRSAPNQK